MRERLLHHADLFRKLRQLLVLFTLFSLPQTAWGATETVTKTITLNKSVSETNFPEGQGLSNGSITLPVTITENGAPYGGQITIESASISSYSSDTNGAVFKMKGSEASSSVFHLEVPGNYPAIPSQVTVETAYANASENDAYFSVELDGSLDPGNTKDYKSTSTSLPNTTVTFTADGNPRTNRSSEGTFDIWFTIRANWDLTNQTQTTVTVKEISITYTRDVYGITVAGTSVKSDNATDILGDGKVSYNATTNTLTLNGATINYTTGDAITSSTTNPLNVNILGTNSISCGDHKAFNTSGNLVFQTSGGVAPGQLTITSTSNIDPQNYYTCSGTVTYQNSLVATNPTSTSVLIAASSSTDYGITVAGTAVTSANASAITGTGITGTVSYEAATNTLTLTDAGITSDNNALTYSGNTLLTIALNGTNSITATSGTYTIDTTGGGDIKFVKATGASTAAKLTVSSGDGSQYVFNGTYPSLGSGLYWKPIAGNQMVITEDPEFVIVGNYVISGTDNGTNGTIAYNASDKILTLTGYTKDFGAQHAIKTGVSGLKVKLVGASTITCSADSAVFHAFSSSASIQFIKDDATSKLTMTGTAYKNFGSSSITYDGLFYYSDNTNKVITQAAAPALSRVIGYSSGYAYTFATIDYAASDKSGGSVLYAAANPVLKYSFDYADPQKQDVSNQAYPDGGIQMTDPGILTTWVEIGTYKGPESKGVRFGLLENPIEMEFDGIAKQISITPAPTMTNPVTINVNSDSETNFNGFAVLDAQNNKITINNCYDGRISFTFTNTDGGYTPLNMDSTNVTFNVIPSKPTLSLESGLYYPGQQITATPTVPDAAYNSYFKINGNTEAGYTQPYTYTFSSAGVFDVSSVTYYIRGGNLGQIFGKYVEAKIIINAKPILNAMVENTEPYVAGHGQVGDIYIDIRGDQNNSDPLVLQTDCKLYYYIGSNKNNAVEYNPANHIRLTESNTVTAYIVYTDPTDATIVYESEPVSASYIVNQQMADPFGANQNYKTYYLDEEYSMKKPDGMKVYVITGVSGNSVTTSTLDYIPSKKPVLLEKEAAATNGYYNAETYTGAEVDLSGNLLKYTGTNTSVNTTGKEYILYKNEFVKATGEISADKCYLDLSGVSFTRGAYGIGDGSTAIDATLFDNEETMSDNWYDLQGRRILKPTKPGLYIVNGKKVIINNK